MTYTKYIIKIYTGFQEKYNLPRPPDRPDSLQACRKWYLNLNEDIRVYYYITKDEKPMPKTQSYTAELTCDQHKRGEVESIHVVARSPDQAQQNALNTCHWRNTTHSQPGTNWRVVRVF